MIDIVLIKLIEEYSGLPIYRQGSVSPDEPYPTEFWTFWEPENIEQHYDNKAAYNIRCFSICFYSAFPETARNTVQDLRKKLKNMGIASTPPEDTASDEISHIGLAIDVFYKEIY